MLGDSLARLSDKIKQLNKQYDKFKKMDSDFRKKNNGYNIRAVNFKGFKTLVKEHDKLIRLEKEVNGLLHKRNKDFMK